MANLVTNYIERLSKYYKIYGSCASMHASKYRIKIDDDIEFSLTQDKDDVVATIKYRIGRKESLDNLIKFLNRLSEINDDDNKLKVKMEGAVPSTVFGGI